MSEDNKCPICGEETVISEANNMFGKFFSCNHCGRIHIEQSVYETLLNNEDLKLKACLYFYFTHQNKGKVNYLITNIKDAENKDKQVLQVDEIKNLYPDNISEKVDKILLNLSNMSSEVGNSFIFPYKKGKFEHLLFITNYEDSEHIRANLLDFLSNINYIKMGKSLPKEGAYCTISYEGWKRIDEVNKKYKSFKKAFIAMWFEEETDWKRDIIKKSIREKGYTPIIIDEKQHNGFIVPEIIHEIETSDFVVADLTGNRGGVYFEAGYAMALGKTLILTVDDRKDEKGENLVKPHFDVAQINQVRYKGEEDLKKGLMNRIEATVGKVN